MPLPPSMSNQYAFLVKAPKPKDDPYILLAPFTMLTWGGFAGLILLTLTALVVYYAVSKRPTIASSISSRSLSSSRC